ncbi:MAG TPA: hypothetical protein VHD81_13045 [Mycobacteriales bacterium]|nr:hypothetical protein [Mycobacteriales bacterium]
MTVSGYAAGMAAVLAVLLSAVVVGIAGRRVLAPRWTGTHAALVAVVVGYSFVVVEGELLGSFGWFSRGPIVGVSVVAAALCGVRLRRDRRSAPAHQTTTGESPAVVEDSASDTGRWRAAIPSYVASVCGALVVAQALVAVRATARTGNLFVDSLEYHLTWAAHFATTHRTTDIIQFAPGQPVPYYPLNNELVHGMGIALFHGDALSMVLTFADLAAVMLAAWCVGATFGAGPVALCAVTPMLALLGTYDASAINDWAAIWPLLAVLAVMVRFRADGQDATIGLPFVAGLAGGLAMGTKLSLLGPTLALLLGFLVIVPSGRRRTATIVGAAGALLTSAYWYVRDAVQVGSPFPSQHVPGLHRVPMSGIDSFGYSVAHYLTNSTVVRQYFRPGLHFFFGKAWLVLLALAVIGVVIGAALGPYALRLAAIVAVIATLVYLVTPTGAYGPAGHPYLFAYNVRYALPAVALSLVALGASRLSVRWPIVMSVVFALTLVVTLLGPRMWALGNGTRIAAVVAVVVCAVIVRLPVVQRHGAAVSVVALVVVAVAGYPATHRYLNDRYHGTSDAKEALYGAMQGQSGVKVGVIGGTAVYPFLGVHYTNSAEYVGQTLAHHAFADYTSCPSWRAAVKSAGYDFVVVELGPNSPPPPALEWTSTDPAATQVFTNAAGSIYSIGPGFGSAACPAA